MHAGKCEYGFGLINCHSQVRRRRGSLEPLNQSADVEEGVIGDIIYAAVWMVIYR